MGKRGTAVRRREFGLLFTPELTSKSSVTENEEYWVLNGTALGSTGLQIDLDPGAESMFSRWMK